MTLILILILWTWGLTPLWVNILATILAIIKLVYCIVVEFMKGTDEGRLWL